MSNSSTKTDEKGKSWEKFDLESVDFVPLAPKKEEASFVSFQEGGKKDEDFASFEEQGGLHQQKREAEDIVTKARKHASALEKEAYEKGFAQGEKDGLELGDKKATKVVEQIEKLLVEVTKLKGEMIRQYEREILEIIFFITEKVVHRKIRSDATIIRETISKAVQLATKKSRMILRVNPEDFDYVEQLKPEFFSEFREMKSIMVTSDRSITRGGCFIETPYGDVDARIETQLEKIYQCLDDAFQDSRDG